MTLTFKDPNGVEWRVIAERNVDHECPLKRPATTADLLAALGQLSTGSDGPTDEELESLYDVEMPKVVNWRRIYLAGRAVGLVRLLGEHPTVGEVLMLDDRSALFAAGSASRQAEVDRLTVERDALQHTAREKELDALLFEERAQRKRERSERRDAESELSATKAKLAESERLHASAVESHDSLCEVADQLRSKLAEVERERALGKTREEAVIASAALRAELFERIVETARASLGGRKYGESRSAAECQLMAAIGRYDALASAGTEKDKAP